MTIRLLKVVAQAYLVDDDGENLREILADAVVIAPADLAAFPGQVFADIAAMNKAENSESEEAPA